MRPTLYFFISLLLFSCAQDSGNSAPSPGAGIGGSTARFTVSGNTLYLIHNDDLHAYDITQSSDPKPGNKTDLWTNGVETIFPYRNNLFIGTQTGMLIYDVRQPGNPLRLGVYTHIQACDPVVAQGNYAYVTLRSGTTCRATTINSLDVIDISNLVSPKLIKSYAMKNPHGLGVDGSLLFVGEGDYGLRVMDVSNPLDVREMQYIDSVRTYDVIPTQKRLIVTGPNGIYQYGYADLKQLTLLSKIPVQ
ncbi:LVIVD repeat-containing protein [Spirosoma montaniterrae]|uniref:LVIVD repeat-containing protein n=1 Tax=Spirosoma montaniterrae TaxID=1178516 RepID=A0A1P9X437_9BACT|nr:hypothetical protein [Spirosoma montaniterrae]AQG82402.1 hypothetical protein AWR27_08895 [Spirosoma montaniterrae]